MTDEPAAADLPRVLCDVLSLTGDRDGAGLRVAWRLTESGRQLDANLVNLPGGQRVDEHTEPDLDVLLVVLAGAGAVDTASGRSRIAAGGVVWLPRGSTRALSADSGGISYLTLHTRRPGLRIGRARVDTQRDSPGSPPVEAGMSTTTVTDNPDTARYEITVGGENVGFVEYHLHQQVIALLHTEIRPAYSGKGLGTILVRATLDDVRARGLHVQPFCEFVRVFIAENPDYLPLVAAEDRPRFRLAD